MTVRHLKPGEDFGPEHFAETGFGFTSSAKGGAAKPTHGSKSVAEPKEEGESAPGDYAKGGHVHPHGHHIVRVAHEEDGRVVMHHAHGGHSVTHMDGMITHHHHDGSPVDGGGMGPQGREEMHDESEYAHNGMARDVPTRDASRASPNNIRPEDSSNDYAKGGRSRDPDAAEDKAMIKKGISQHENHEHGGEHTDLKLAGGGGFPHMRPRLGPAMRPKAEKMHSPINTAPRNPGRTTTPRNAMPGGQLGYGVEPSAEPDQAGADQTGIPQMRRGGHKKHED